MTAMYTPNLSLDVVRHATLTSILYAKNKFGSQYGEPVFACDDKENWRKEIFPYYKANRKKDRTTSKIDWHMLLDYLNIIKEEFKENLPYKFLQVSTAEADDIIASLVMTVTDESKLIYSSDGDFVQLLAYPNTALYSPRLKKQIKDVDPHKYLLEHVMEGDTSDGVPNMLSPDTCLVEKVRQKSLTSKIKAKYLQALSVGQMPFTENQKQYFLRNRQMIDLKYIPINILEEAMVQYTTSIPAARSKLFPYFFGHQMTRLMERLQEF